MATENFDNFNERLSQWVASQGFWFQLRFSMASGGSKGVVMVHAVRFAIRLTLLLLVAGLGAGFYLYKLPGTKRFQDQIESAISKGLGANESELSGFKRVQGVMQIAKLASEGSNTTFYSSLEARNIKCQMGILNMLPGKWNLGVLAIGELDIHLNAGADDAESAKGIANSVFRQFGNLECDTIDVRDATVRWGFSERTRGVIIGSQLKCQRMPDGWRIQVAGGQFSQNWLRRLDIVEMTVICTRAGVLFEKAEFRKGTGRVTMNGLNVKAGERPEVKGTVVLTRVPIEDLIPPDAQDFVDGSISGEFRMFGSTNNKEGLGLEGKVTVDESNPIRLRDRIYLLRALTEFAVFSNFKTVVFKSGSMNIKTQAGGMLLSDVELQAPQEKASDLMTLVGQVQVRYPTPDEAAAAVERNRNRAGSPLAGAGAPRDSVNPVTPGDDPDFTLRKIGLEMKKAKERQESGSGDEAPSLFDKIGQGFEARRMEEQAVERESRTLIYEGGFQITLLPDTFETLPSLRELYPVDAQNGRIPMDVPIKGDLFSITYDLTEDLYLRAKRY
jgi:hypothetical protein